MFRIRPVIIRSYPISRNGILESQAISIAFQHGFQERPVYHVHFLLAVPVCKFHSPAAHNGLFISHIPWHLQVHENVGKWGLGTPAAGGVDSKDKRLHAFLDLIVGQVIRLHKGSQVGVKGRK